MQRSVLGYFDKSMARRFKEALEEDGVAISTEKVRVPQGGPRVKITVDAGDYPKAVELVRKLEIQYLIQAREKARSFERKAMTVFFIFTLLFVTYIIVSNI